MKTVQVLGIKAPNSAILAENIIKNGADDGLILTLSPGSEEGLENVAEKYGFAFEVDNLKDKVVVRMTKSQAAELDVTGETCPGPIILVGDKLSSMATGERLKVKSKSSEAIEDIAISIPEMNGKVVEKGTDNNKTYILLEKVEKAASTSAAVVNRDKVLVAQSNGIGNAERAYATFIFSKAAISMGKKVTIFLLMDGVSIAKKGNAEKVKHPSFDRLDNLMIEVIEMGAKVYVCELSAEFRGMKQEDLVKGTSLAGAATYITLLSDPTYAVVNF
ncbi:MULTISPECIES: DsrE family protein [Methanobacterium]|uniref:DsrE family protein n=1 Tax=Methanobacterium veterum TaxID=408577 RepID=A0A9E4ZXI5_9EURY|nr:MULTISPECIES: DsrE family protein [Methanobacterium]MCZ3367387.1 DsrE family protein [Methanobacterium veterum]MCZ3373465.1 DsrE family protein [Methanobacterium veterum]